MKSIRVLVLVLCASSLAFGGDNEFRGVVNAIEHNCGVHHMRIPLLGFALFLAKPKGVSGLRLAVFEGFQAPPAADVQRIVEKSLGPEWYPFVRVRSKNDSETTLIYANPSADKMRMMIVNVESSEATVVELKIGDRAIKEWLKEPGERAEDNSGHRHHADN
jgi:hypothetical protein